MITLDQRTSSEISKDLARRVAAIRKRRGYTQASCALRAGVSQGSLKRFEQSGEVSFTSLIKIAIALGLEDELDQLFRYTAPASIREIIRAQKNEQ